MKRLIILSYDYSPNNGGVARLCWEIKKQCEANDLEHLVVTPVKGPDERNVVRITGKRGIVEWKILRYLNSIKKDGDVVLCGLFHPEGFLSLLAGFPTYMLAHGAEFLPGKSFFRRKIWNLYRKQVLRKASRIIANSHYTAGLVEQCSGVHDVVALPLAVDTAHFYPTQGKTDDGLLHLCSISRLEAFKAQDFIIETIAGLPEMYRNRIRLSIGGKGVYKQVLEEMVKSLHLEGIVSFEGFIPDDKLKDFYSAHDVFILCTREIPGTQEVEGFGLVFTEAQACGTACIGSRSGGIPDAIEEGNGGWLIRQDDKAALSKLLRNFIDDPSIARNEGKKALQRVREKCTWDKYFNELRRCFK